MSEFLKTRMGSKKWKLLDEPMKALLAKIEHAGNHPELYPVEALPDDWSHVDLKLDVDFDIDFSAPPPERKPAAPSPVASAAGTKKVTIRIPNRIIDAFKANTKVSGGRYQTKMIRALEKAALALPR